MERVAFLIEHTGERIGCLLNPESFVMRRAAGVRARQASGGSLTGTRLTDDPLLFTGGGETEMILDLFFDVSLADAERATENVRDLTRPLWKLAENIAGRDDYGQITPVRFVWGKAWNVLGVVTAVAERFEQFTAQGTPQRSWLRMRLVRITEPPAPVFPTRQPEPDAAFLDDGGASPFVGDFPTGGEGYGTYTVLGGGEDATDRPTERPDEIAASFYGPDTNWKLLYALNDIADPLHVRAGTVLRIPPLSFLEGRTS